MKIRNTDLLLPVDLQNDFIIGSLAVTGAKNIIPVVNRYMEKFEYILFSGDMHSINHISFRIRGGPWPIHCVADTDGVKLYSDLNIPVDLFMVYKGTIKDKEAYSAFEATQLFHYTLSYGGIIVDKLDLSAQLRLMGIKRLFICGLATDYCVKATVLDATENKKFNGPVFLLTDAIKAVELIPGDGDKAILEMTKAGAIPITLKDLTGV